MIQVLRLNGEVVKGYLISKEGKIFQGKNRTPVNYFFKNGDFYFNLVINSKVVAVKGAELVLSNFHPKPTDYKSVVKFKKCVLNDPTPLNVENLYWAKIDTLTKEQIESVDINLLKNMKSVFIKGVLTNLLVDKEGNIYTQQGKRIEPKISRRGLPYIERPLPYDLGIGMEFIRDIVIENYKLPHGDMIANYHISYLDKNKKNCSVNNLILWREGYAGIAKRKLVKVFKDGCFYGAFTSVQKCSEIINIPRRRISELLKTGDCKNGFKVIEFKNW